MGKFEKRDIFKIVITFVVVTIICFITGKIVEGTGTECLLNQVDIPAFIPAIFICSIFVLNTLFKDKRNGEKINFKNVLIYFGISYLFVFIFARVFLAILGAIVRETLDEGSLSVGGFFSLIMVIVFTIYLKLWQFPLKSKEYIILLLVSDVSSVMISFIYGKAIIFSLFAIFIWILAFSAFFGKPTRGEVEYNKGYQEGLSNVGSLTSLMTSEQRRGYEEARKKVEDDKITRGF